MLANIVWGADGLEGSKLGEPCGSTGSILAAMSGKEEEVVLNLKGQHSYAQLMCMPPTILVHLHRRYIEAKGPVICF